ncbi:hypothetical protein SPAN111604_05555 [Sphingomonas antarctica]|uniref:hypothetical protein n=1 Tax=Sphingomonas antarctica TaxID=2040274 RepID=UPI0039E86868
MASQPTNPSVPALVETLDDMPDYYASVCKGRCLEPEYMDGCTLAFTKKGKPKTGEYVCLWFKPEKVPHGEHQCMVKRVVMALPDECTFPFNAGLWVNAVPFMIVEMLNPPRQFPVKASDLLGIHRMLGEVDHDGQGMARLPRSWMEEA